MVVGAVVVVSRSKYYQMTVFFYRQGLLVFMSDGGCGDFMKAMKAVTHMPHTVQCHTIFFGDPAGEPAAVANLKTMAEATSGKAHTCIDGVQLEQTFVEVASGGIEDAS